MTAKRRQRHRDVADRQLPGPDQRIAADQAADRAIPDGHQESLIGDRRQAQQPFERLGRIDAVRSEIIARRHGALRLAPHSRRLAEERRDRHVDRVVAKARVVHHKLPIAGRAADHRGRAAFAPAQGEKLFQTFGRDREHVTFLRLVAPDLERRHARLVVRHCAQFDAPAPLAVRNDFRDRIRETAGPDVMDDQDRIVRAHGPATIDDFLGAALHFRVAALHRCKIELLAAGAATERRRGTAAESDQHRRPADEDEPRADRHLALLDMHAPYVAEPAGNHDRLVIAADDAGGIPRQAHLKGTEIAEDARASEFVVERGRADRPVEHDLERGRDARRAAMVGLPGLLESGYTQIRHGETDQARFRLRAEAGRAFVPYFTARASRGPREWRDRRRVIVGLDLDQDVGRLLVPVVTAIDRVREKSPRVRAFDHCRIVAVGGQHALGAPIARVADHLEQ